MFREEGYRPSDRRGFVHKSFIGKAVGSVAKGIVPGLSTAADVISGASKVRKALAKSTGATAKFPTLGAPGGFRPTSIAARAAFVPNLPCNPGESLGDCVKRRAASALGLAGQTNGDCAPPLIRSPQGNCIAPTSPRGAELFGGNATMGRYGAAEIPGTMIIDRATCRRGTQLGDDGLCYAKGTITNKQRMWPAGRRPLLTGGDMRAIGTAARAGAKLERTTKRLRALGMMKKLPSGRGAPRAHAHAKPVAAVSV